MRWSSGPTGAAAIRTPILRGSAPQGSLGDRAPRLQARMCSPYDRGERARFAKLGMTPRLRFATLGASGLGLFLRHRADGVADLRKLRHRCHLQVVRQPDARDKLAGE